MPVRGDDIVLGGNGSLHADTACLLAIIQMAKTTNDWIVSYHTVFKGVESPRGHSVQTMESLWNNQIYPWLDNYSRITIHSE